MHEQGKEALTCPHSEFTEKETGGKRLETWGANPSPGPRPAHGSPHCSGATRGALPGRHPKSSLPEWRCLCLPCILSFCRGFHLRKVFSCLNSKQTKSTVRGMEEGSIDEDRRSRASRHRYTQYCCALCPSLPASLLQGTGTCGAGLSTAAARSCALPPSLCLLHLPSFRLSWILCIF